MGEIDVEGAGFGIAVIEEGDAGDGARPADFCCRIDLLRQGVSGIGAARKKAETSTCAVTDSHKVGVVRHSVDDHLIAPLTGVIGAADRTDLDPIVCSGSEPVQCIGVRGDSDRIGLVAVDADLPFGCVTAFGPTQHSGSLADNGDGRVGGRWTR